MWLPSLEFIADSLNISHSINWKIDFSKFDLNGDGVIDAKDCFWPHGSAEAKLWFHTIIESHVAHTGHYKGYPVEQGQMGEGNYHLLVDKLIITEGLSVSSAYKVANKIKAIKYG